MSADNSSYLGSQDQASASDHFLAYRFLAEQIRNLADIATLVKVVSVTVTPGTVGPVGQVSVQPLVNQINGYGQPTPHETVYGLAYIRYGGGPNAVILNPEPGDIGLAIFADRDISSVKASSLSTGQPANPGSRRRNSMSDGIYLGVALANAPKQYVAFTKSGSDRGITQVDANGNSIVMDKDGITISDANGNSIVTSSSGIKFVVANGNHVDSTAGGTLSPVETVGGASTVARADE